MPELETWRTELDRWGFWRFIYLHISSKTRRWLLLYRVNVRIQNLDASRDSISNAGLKVRLALRDDLLRAAEDPSLGLVPADIDSALDRGDLCAAAFAGERIVAYVWRCFTTARLVDDIWIELRKPYRYGYKAYTDPEYRGRHLQDDVSLYTDALCVERGYTHALSLIEPHNFASINSDRRRANRLVGWIGYLKILGRVYLFRSPGARKCSLRLYRRFDGQRL